MAAAFTRAGYEIVPLGEPCDVCVIHGCTVTRTAEQKSLRYARAARKLAPPPLVVLAGCVVEAAADDVQSRSEADLVVGQKDKLRLPEIIRNHGLRAKPTGASGVVPNHGPAAPDDHRRDSSHAGLPPGAEKTRALVKVQDGCDFRCAYCIVPAARGRPVSRPSSEIVTEVRRLADSGCREIVLTGANLGCYADGDTRLIDLLIAIESVPGIERIRLSSIELSTVERQIIDYMTQSDRLCRFLHVPIQTGDDTLLAAMGRRYTIRQYRTFIDYALERVPLLGLGTDVVVGLPGETEAAFNNTLQVVRDLPFCNLHIFPYSRRPGTRAAAMSGHVGSADRKGRTTMLLQLAPEKKLAFAEKCLGHSVAVLVEQIHPDGSGTGWTQEYVEARLTRRQLTLNSIVSFKPSAFDGRFLTE